MAEIRKTVRTCDSPDCDALAFGSCTGCGKDMCCGCAVNVYAGPSLVSRALVGTVCPTCFNVVRSYVEAKLKPAPVSPFLGSNGHGGECHAHPI